MQAPLHPIARDRGFSLVEIVLALGITAFCLMALLGLMTTGLQSQKVLQEETEAAALATTILEDLRNAAPNSNSPAFKIGPVPSAGGDYYESDEQLYFSRAGVLTSQDAAFFAVTLRITPPERAALPYLVFLRLDWPAAAAPENRPHGTEFLDAYRLSSQGVLTN